MIPYLYKETANVEHGIETSDMICELKDAISCKVIENDSGKYELELVYPLSGTYANSLLPDRIIASAPNLFRLLDYNAQGELDTNYCPDYFRIYRTRISSDKTVTAYAEHISYILSNMYAVSPPVYVGTPLVLTNLYDAIDAVKLQYSRMNPDGDATRFHFTWVKGVANKSGNVKINYGDSFRDLLITISKQFEIEVEFTGHRILFTGSRRRNTQNPWNLIYGKNIKTLTADITDEYLVSGIYMRCHERYKFTRLGFDYETPYSRIGYKDFTNDFTAAPSAQELDDYMRATYLPKVGTRLMKLNVEPILELKNQPIYIGDAVKIYAPEFGIDGQESTVTSYVFDAINERYESLKIGEATANLSEILFGKADK